MLRILIILLFAFVVDINDIYGQQAIKVADKEVVDLRFEVDAIEFLLILDLEKNQKEILKKLVVEKIDFEILDIPKYTEEYLKKLRNVRNALLEDNEELADNLRLELDDIVEKNMIEVDYVYEVNESSRRNAKDFLKLIRIDQL